jgi:hypothetical protein
MSDEDNDASASRKGTTKLRRGHKKVKTGCTDCRRRRVKVSTKLPISNTVDADSFSVPKRSLNVVLVSDVGLNANTHFSKQYPFLQTGLHIHQLRI